MSYAKGRWQERKEVGIDAAWRLFVHEVAKGASLAAGLEAVQKKYGTECERAVMEKAARLLGRE